MSPIFNNYVEKCRDFWRQNWQTFSNHQMPVTNPLPNNLIKDPYPGFEVAVFNDPGCGGTYGENVYQKENGLLIVGCNPSGIAKHCNKRNPVCQKQNYSDFYIVNTYPLTTVQNKKVHVNDSYTKAIHDFAVACNFTENYYKMDVFGIMRKEQRVLEDDMNNGSHNKEYAELFDIFVSTVEELKPKVIVVVNAFVRYLFQNVFKEKIRYDENQDPQCGGHIAKFGNHDTYIFFTSMLSGGRALDVGSRELLVWAVNRYKNRYKYNNVYTWKNLRYKKRL